jgi:phosphatidylinositol alpha-1,6-mannosyltransferase
MTDLLPDYVLVSQIFPPVVGGSGALLQNIYSRVGEGRVTALVNVPAAVASGLHEGPIRVRRTKISEHSWGLFDPRGWPNQLHVARTIYRYAGHGRGIVHCGRAQPEGVSALLASLAAGGPRYLFWVHGEDIAAAMSSRQYAATMRLVYRRASAAIANSQNTARMIRSLGWCRSGVHVVYPGVDATRFHPAAGDGSLRRRLAPNGELLLLSVSRLQKRKGHELVLRALHELIKDFPGTRYVIVGDGGERDALEQLVTQLRLDELVRFEGEVDDAALPAYFSASDIFVLPTRVEPFDFEGFGLVYLEAAAAAKPSIGGRNGGVPEAVVESETGMLVTGESVEELLAALRLLCLSPDLRLRMGQAGRARVVRDFTWERAAAEVTDIHRNLAARARPGRSRAGAGWA